MSELGYPQQEASIIYGLDGNKNSTGSGGLAAYRAQAAKIRGRIADIRSKSSFGQSSVTEQTAKDQKRKQETDEAEAQERLERRVAAETARAEHRALVKERANLYRSDKHARKADEKKRNKHMGGVAWGFDPTAGIRVSEDKTRASTGCWVFGGRTGTMQGHTGAGESELDELGRRTGRRWDSEGTWGIEAGGPGKEGKFGHGSLRNKQSRLGI